VEYLAVDTTAFALVKTLSSNRTQSPQPTFASLGVGIVSASTPYFFNRAEQSNACVLDRNIASIVIFVIPSVSLEYYIL
jgi:hypothetical protein